MPLNAAFISSSLCGDVVPFLWAISPMCFAAVLKQMNKNIQGENKSHL